MSRKKPPVPSKNSLTIRQRISQLFENLEYESEASDPSIGKLSEPGADQDPIPDKFIEKKTSGDYNYDKDGNHLFSSFQVPSPEPTTQPSTDRRYRFSDPVKLPGYEFSVDAVGKVRKNNKPVTWTINDSQSTQGTIHSVNENNNMEFMRSAITFTPQKSETRYQICLNLINKPNSSAWNDADRELIENLLKILAGVLEQSTELS